jgi:hypothetical protein
MEIVILRLDRSTSAKMSVRIHLMKAAIAFGPPSRQATPGLPTIRKPVSLYELKAQETSSFAILPVVNEMKRSH